MGPLVQIKRNRAHILQRRHPWIFSGAIAKVWGEPQAGEIVDIVDEHQRVLAKGFYHPNCDIAVRILTTQPEQIIDASFWRQRLRQAMELRRRVVPPQTNAYRLINAEGDGIPGLIVDDYDGYSVASISTAGVDRIREMIFKLLIEETQARGLYERSEGAARQREGLPERVGLVVGELPPADHKIVENGLSFYVDLVAGQKTGFFLDQRPNRQLIGQISSNSDVLNCFAYSGGFSVYAAAGGANRVVSVEISAAAAQLAQSNLTLNGYSGEQYPVIQQDVFTFLRQADDGYDVIILDPPAFAKSRQDMEKAARGYKEINLQALKRLRGNGLLATFSCSNHIDAQQFERIVMAAAMDAGATLQVLERLGPGADHPQLLTHEEGRYLKGLLLRKIED